MGEGVKKAAHFLPVYWYEVNNGIISSYASLSGEKLNEVWLGIGIQLLFAVVFIGIALVITKHRRQEK